MLGNITAEGQAGSNENTSLAGNAEGLNGVPQNASLVGGAGDDSVVAFGGTRGRNTLWGGEGNDTMRNFGDESYVNGEAGNDTIFQEAGYGESTLMGGAGDDSVDASNGGTVGGGTNLLWGGEGSDTLIGSNPDVATNPNAPGDTLYGGDAANTDTSADSLVGGANSLMLGNQGNDTLVAGDGTNAATNSSLYGGQGEDSLFIGAGSSTISLWGDLGSDTLNTNGTANNSLEGGEGNDSLYGLAAGGAAGGGNNSLSGGDGNDILVAGTTVGNNEGNDTLIGGLGNDFFFGSVNGDTLGGQEGTTREGSDTLYGGQGADSLIGISGFDGFYYANSIEIGADSLTADTITSFQSGTDKIYLRSGSDTRTNSFGNANSALGGGAGNALRDGLDFEAVTYDYAASGTFSGDGTIQPAIVFQDTGDGGLLYWDWSGGANADTAANLSVIATIEIGRVAASDIVIF
jgi:Ca2+-binding RTX toxin-like protein